MSKAYAEGSGRNMGITIRKAVKADLDGIAEIYEHIHTEEESGRACIGWIRGVYPERQTAEAALDRGDLFVEELDGRLGDVRDIKSFFL